MGTAGTFDESKATGYDADLSRQIVEVKKAWSYISAPPYVFIT